MSSDVVNEIQCLNIRNISHTGYFSLLLLESRYANINLARQLQLFPLVAWHVTWNGRISPELESEWRRTLADEQTYLHEVSVKLRQSPAFTKTVQDTAYCNVINYQVDHCLLRRYPHSTRFNVNVSLVYSWRHGMPSTVISGRCAVINAKLRSLHKRVDWLWNIWNPLTILHLKATPHFRMLTSLPVFLATAHL